MTRRRFAYASLVAVPLVIALMVAGYGAVRAQPGRQIATYRTAASDSIVSDKISQRFLRKGETYVDDASTLLKPASYRTASQDVVVSDMLGVNRQITAGEKFIDDAATTKLRSVGATVSTAREQIATSDIVIGDASGVHIVKKGERYVETALTLTSVLAYKAATQDWAMWNFVTGEHRVLRKGETYIDAPSITHLSQISSGSPPVSPTRAR